MLKTFRNHPWLFWISTVAAVALRIHFGLNRWSQFDGDALVYVKLATSIIQHHTLGFTHGDICVPTMIRLPGYPMFLAGVYSVFGLGNYRAVLMIQALVDLATCFIIADIARRLIGDRAARWAYAVAAVCPFLATYVGAVLTECLECFFTAVAIDLAIVAFDAYKLGGSTRRSLMFWALCGLSIFAAITLRPDGGLVLPAIGLPMIWQMCRNREWKHYLVAGFVTCFFALAPLTPWAIRNYKVFHVFQPLVSVDAVDPGEFSPHGFNDWVYTWVIDYSTTEDLTFRIDGEEFNLEAVPDRAYSDQAEREQVAKLAAEYNENVVMTPEIDAEFGKIAQRRIHEHWFKIRVVYPIVREITMWFRPRTEMLPLDTHWWAFQDDPHDSTWATLLAIVNALYIFAAIAGAILGRKEIRYLSLLLTYPLLRSAMLWYLHTVEDRYTLECYPMVLVLAGYFVGVWMLRQKKNEESAAVVAG